MKEEWLKVINTPVDAFLKKKTRDYSQDSLETKICQIEKGSCVLPLGWYELDQENNECDEYPFT